MLFAFMCTHPIVHSPSLKRAREGGYVPPNNVIMENERSPPLTESQITGTK